MVEILFEEALSCLTALRRTLQAKRALQHQCIFELCYKSLQYPCLEAWPSMHLSDIDKGFARQLSAVLAGDSSFLQLLQLPLPQRLNERAQ